MQSHPAKAEPADHVLYRSLDPDGQRRFIVAKCRELVALWPLAPVSASTTQRSAETHLLESSLEATINAARAAIAIVDHSAMTDAKPWTGSDGTPNNARGTK
ncbi:hypothetical protein EsH8_XV_000008 [Colletotrichum jinshuiense]